MAQIQLGPEFAHKFSHPATSQAIPKRGFVDYATGKFALASDIPTYIDGSAEKAAAKQAKMDAFIAKAGSQKIGQGDLDAFLYEMNSRPGTSSTMKDEYSSGLGYILSKYDLRHNPTLNSEASAQLWIDQRIQKLSVVPAGETRQEKAARERELNKMRHLAIETLDMDSDTTTPDNVVLIDSSKTEDNIYSIDGFRLGNIGRAMLQRESYDFMPDRATRGINKELLKVRRKWSAKYTTEAERAAHPFTREEIARIQTAGSVRNQCTRYVHALLADNDLQAKAKPAINPQDTSAQVVQKIEAAKIAPPRMTSDHYLKITGRLVNWVYSHMFIPDLVALSGFSPQVKAQLKDYDFAKDDNHYLKNKAFMEQLKATMIQKDYKGPNLAQSDARSTGTWAELVSIAKEYGVTIQGDWAIHEIVDQTAKTEGIKISGVRNSPYLELDTYFGQARKKPEIKNRWSIINKV
jgi:hypothetical protein